MSRKKVVPIKEQPTWEEWVSLGETAAKKSTEDPVGLAGASAEPGLMHEAIAILAYSYWEARGCQGGSAEEDWFRAEVEIQRQRSAALTTKPLGAFQASMSH